MIGLDAAVGAADHLRRVRRFEIPALPAPQENGGCRLPRAQNPPWRLPVLTCGLTAFHRGLRHLTRLLCKTVRSHERANGWSLTVQQLGRSFMARLRFDPVTYQFYYRCAPQDGGPAKSAGFGWDPVRRRYYTEDPRVAVGL